MCVDRRSGQRRHQGPDRDGWRICEPVVAGRMLDRRRIGAAARHERLAATVACKAAIKGGDALSTAEMQALYVGLASTTLPAHDVHGRSTIVQITWDELDRRFGRK